MTKDEALKKMQAVKTYMTSGNPIWDVTEIGEAFGMAIEALERPEPQWIPCKERLPENNVEVLVSTTWGSIEIAWLSKGTWVTEAYYFDDDRLPIAWMPLPVPYKEEAP